MITNVFIQARLGSTRLPAKVLLPMPNGRTVLHEVIWRARAIDGIDKIVVTVPGKDLGLIGNAVGVTLGANRRSFIFGSTVDENDVLSRFAQAAMRYPADAYMRITADCPMFNPIVCSELLRRFWESGADYASNAWPARSYPHGWDCEVFTHAMLARADDAATTASDREHVTPWMQHVAQRTGASLLLKSMEDRSNVRVTLDTLEDYRAICREFYSPAIASLNEN